MQTCSGQRSMEPGGDQFFLKIANGLGPGTKTVLAKLVALKDIYMDEPEMSPDTIITQLNTSWSIMTTRDADKIRGRGTMFKIIPKIKFA